jgi:uncharacterized protein YijF (DUF1287 family)
MPDLIDRRSVIGGGLAVLIAACGPAVRAETRPASPRAMQLIAAAQRQIGVTVNYDPAYTRLAYPGGDVPRGRGVCTDVVVRAYRDAFGIDLQREVHEDMARAFATYPRRWGLSRPDRNIDHRRVPNLERFWDRKEARLALSNNRAAWQPGDLFTSLVGGSLPHTGIISDKVAANGNPLVIHNIGSGAQEEDVLFAHRLTGHFRWRL